MLLPLAILAFVQYRSLVDLEEKTRVAVENDLRRAAAVLARRAREQLEALAAEALAPVSAADLEAEGADHLAHQLEKVRRARPEIEAAFVVSHCACRERNFALFATPAGVRRVDHDELKRDAQAQATIDAYHSAELLQAASGAAKGMLFEQSACALQAFGRQDHSFHGDHAQLTIFSPLGRNGGEGQAGFAGIVLGSEYVKRTLLPQLAGELMKTGEGAGLAVGVIDEKGSEVYALGRKVDDYELTAPFAPVFRRWRLGIGYEETTIEALARGQFRQNLLLAALALGLLAGGVALTLRAVARERRLVEAKATFVSNVSHELKTPLSLIRLFAETLEMGRVGSNAEVEHYGRIINRESGRLTQLIDNILDFSRIEAGRRDYIFVATDVAALLAEVLESHEEQIKSAGFTLKTEIEADLPRALIDREAITQAARNLIDNAIRYSAEVKEIEVRVHLRGERSAGKQVVNRRIAIEIADRGIGIPRAEQKRIFDKFYRVSTGLIHQTKGSGLGLSIVRHIVEAHKGEIIVESAPGRGSRFTLLLPAAAEKDAAAEKAGAGEKEQSQSPAVETRG